MRADYIQYRFYLNASNLKDIDPDCEDSWTSAMDFCVIPHIGEEIKIYSSRDEDGNYLPKVDYQYVPRHVMTGTVEKIRYTLEERGKDHIENHKVMFVEIFVRGTQERLP